MGSVIFFAKMLKVRLSLIVSLITFLLAFAPVVFLLRCNVNGPLNVAGHFTSSVISEFEEWSCQLMRERDSNDRGRCCDDAAFGDFCDRQQILSAMIDKHDKKVVWRIGAGTRIYLDCIVEFPEDCSGNEFISPRVSCSIDGDVKGPAILRDVLMRRYSCYRKILISVLAFLFLTLFIRLDWVDRRLLGKYVAGFLWVATVVFGLFAIASNGILLLDRGWSKREQVHVLRRTSLPTRGFGAENHIHIGPVSHIPVH